MKNILLFLGLLLTGGAATAQSGNLWASAASGGCYHFGTILRGDNTGNFKTVACFDSLNGAYPIGKMAMAPNGKLYGVTYYGTDLDSCCVFTYDSLTNAITIVYSFFSDTAIFWFGDSTFGGQPAAGLILATNGLLYGTTTDGGANQSGVIYTVDPATNTYTDVYDFTGYNGANPGTELLQAADGKLYGITNGGGISNGPVLFSFDPVNNTYTDVYNYNQVYTYGGYTSTYISSVSDLVQGADGKLYGTLTFYRGNPTYGMLFSYDLKAGVWTQLFPFNDATLQGPAGGITAAGGKICGTLSEGLFMYDINTNTTTTTAFGSAQYGVHPSSLSTVSDNKLMGCTASGGINDAGAIFTVDLNDNAPNPVVFTDIFDFEYETTGSNPMGYILQTGAIATGIKPVTANNIEFYPNPATNVLLVKNAGPSTPYSITDILGQIIDRGVFTAAQQTIDISQLPAGIYLLNNTRFVKQ